ncbi:hypothetical protein Leryth_012878 [Lithospermum erythrorhizon]|nr:hypothetical protein Leryth_012878 [Lithospermum erythrorhizon]
MDTLLTITTTVKQTSPPQSPNHNHTSDPPKRLMKSKYYMVAS